MARSKGGAHATSARLARHLPLKLRMGEDSNPEDILRGLLKSFADGLSSTRGE